MPDESIEDYILSSERNITITAAIVEGWHTARKRVVDGFLNALEARFLAELPGWESERYQEFFVDAYPGLYLWNPEWGDHSYWIVLQCAYQGRVVQLGVMRDVNNLPKELPLSSELLEEVRKHFHDAQASKPWWEAVMPATPATDWSTPESLWRMHKDPQFATGVADRLIEVAEVSAGIIDRLCQGK